MALRPEPAVQYKRLLKRTLVGALRSVFSEEYPDPQLRNLYISTAFPLKREQFPAIIVSYNESHVRNSGVSHFEEIIDEDYKTRVLRHFMFEGNIEMTCYALSPLDLDILSDSVMELLAFGRIDSLLNKFFEAVYEDIGDSAQISLHSDYMTGLGESTMNTLWDAEDLLVYRTGYSIACSGGFYSTAKEGNLASYVDQIIVYGSQPFEEEQEKLLELFGSNTADPFYVKGRGIASSS